jgi:hypothetical protein
MNPFDFVRVHDDPKKISFMKKCDFLSMCPDVTYSDKKKILDSYSREDIEEFFDYYYKLYKARIDNKEVLWL